MPQPEHIELGALPRLPGRADVRLLHTVQRDTLTYGFRRQAVFVRAADAEGVRALEALGVETTMDRWQPARLDAAALSAALAAGGRFQLRSAPAHELLLDVSLREVRAARVHAGRGVEQPRRGKGVLIGIVDSGIDLSHPAFRDASGRSRVVAIWDQDASEGRSPDEFGYGRECSQYEIRHELCPIGDPLGHGTHVAGIAAGNFGNIGNIGNIGLVGVAPESDIAVVRSDTFTRLADAVLYLVRLAENRDTPLVINMSVGGQYGPHDGKTPLEEYLTGIVGPGRILVAAVGNDGNDRIHFQTGLGDAPVRLGLENLPAGVPMETLVDMWSDPGNVVDMALELWIGDEVVATAPLAAGDATLLEGSIHHNGRLLAEVTYGLELDTDRHRAHRTLLVDCSRSDDLPVDGTLAIRFSGSGSIEGWITATDYRYGSPRFAGARSAGWVSGDGRQSVSVPATSPDIISVGAYTGRLTWTSEDETDRKLSGATLGALADYSSLGPTALPSYTGVKPELCAPGSIVVSARAVGVAPGPMTLDDSRMVMQGTSMAAPHVAGAVALMLEADPELDPERVRSQLSRTARTDDATGAGPNSHWGYGKLDVAAAVGVAEAEAGGCAAAAPSSSMAAMAVWLLLRRRRRSLCCSETIP
ncbi:MAG: S8 family serine peptidase [Myxococcota bacterium]